MRQVNLTCDLSCVPLVNRFLHTVDVQSLGLYISPKRLKVFRDECYDRSCRVGQIKLTFTDKKSDVSLSRFHSEASSVQSADLNQSDCTATPGGADFSVALKGGRSLEMRGQDSWWKIYLVNI